MRTWIRQGTPIDPIRAISHRKKKDRLPLCELLHVELARLLKRLSAGALRINGYTPSGGEQLARFERVLQ